jgi:hypothetical protein
MQHSEDRPRASAFEEARRFQQKPDQAAAHARLAWELAEERRLAIQWAAGEVLSGRAGLGLFDSDPEMLTPAIDALLRQRLIEGPHDRPVPNT